MNHTRRLSSRCVGLMLSGLWLLGGMDCRAQQRLEAPEGVVWKDGIGNGFESGVHTLALQAGASYGLAAVGSHEAHHLGLASLSYGQMLGPVVGSDHWHRGNWEWRVELFGGMQFSPQDDWLIGLTPHLRYTFATGGRWAPFLDFGAGVTATGIGPPDLSNTFEFNLQGCVGVHWFLGDHLALTGEARYLHVSCAGISQPNAGLNGVMGLIGLTRFF